MPQFEFRGTSRTGQQITGVRASPSREALDAVLRREQITPTRIVEKGREIAIPKPKVAGKVTQKELAVFTRQFSVMIDPIAVIAIAALVIFALLRYAVPTFATLFAGLGVELPLPTRIVIGLSNSVVSFGWMVILAVGALLYGLKVWYGTPGGRMAVDTVVLRSEERRVGKECRS